MATLDELLSQETKPESQLSEPLADVHGDLAYYDFANFSGASSSKTIDYTVTLDTAGLVEILERFEKVMLGVEEAVRQLGLAAEKAEEIKDDTAPFFGGHWNIPSGSLYVSNGTDMKWSSIGEVESATLEFKPTPYGADVLSPTITYGDLALNA